VCETIRSFALPLNVMECAAVFQLYIGKLLQFLNNEIPILNTLDARKLVNYVRNPKSTDVILMTCCLLIAGSVTMNITLRRTHTSHA